MAALQAGTWSGCARPSASRGGCVGEQHQELQVLFHKPVALAWKTGHTRLCAAAALLLHAHTLSSLRHGKRRNFGIRAGPLRSSRRAATARMATRLPKVAAEMPEQLCAIDGKQPGAAPEDIFTWDTVTKRMPKILDVVVASLPEEAREDEELLQQISDLQTEMREGKPLRLLEDTGPWVNAEQWNQHIKSLVAEEVGWHVAPWWIVENYMYKRLLEALAKASYPELDPFAPQKKEAMESAMPAMEASIEPLLAIVDEAAGKDKDAKQEALQLAVLRSLWGNQADLSLSAGKVESKSDSGELLTDNVSLAVDLLSGAAGKDVVLVLDNHGLEVICDIVLADTILRLDVAETVVLHVKDSPVFVSDVTKNDIEGIVDWLCERSAMFGLRLLNFLETGRLKVRSSSFYTSAHAFWDLPGDLEEEYRQAQVVVLKGDANYRRLLDDRHWPYDTNFAEYVSAFWPSPGLVALRTMKSGVALGVDAASQSKAKSARPDDWLTAGIYGQVLASKQA